MTRKANINAVPKSSKPPKKQANSPKMPMGKGGKKC